MTQLRDLLCNLLHLADRMGLCLAGELSRTRDGYLEEIAEHPVAAFAPSHD